MSPPVDDPAAPRPGPPDAHREARRLFLRGDRIDMGALAQQLGVSRVTLYRWVGSRRSLLSAVLWSLAGAALEEESRRSRAQGARRVILVVTRFIDRVLSTAGVARLLREEGELAIRLLSRQDEPFQAQLVDAVETLICEEVSRGRLALSAGTHEVAYAIVRVVESYIYLDLVIGEQPAAERAEPILELLLR